MEGEKAILEWNDVTTQSIQGQHSPNSDVYEKLANLVKFVENDEHHLELLSNIKVNSYVLVHLLKATRNVQNLTNVLTLIKALSADKKSHELFHSDLAKLLDILSQLALGYSSIVLPEDSLTSILEIINHIFKQKTNMIILYQSTETMELLPQLRKMLEYKSRPGGKKLAKKMAKAAATAFLSIARHREGRRLLNNSEGLIDSLYLFLLFAPEDKAFDTVVHKVGLTILSCIPLQNLPGLGDAHSAFVGPVPCAECSNGTEYALSSDSHTESEPEEDDKKNTIDNKSKKIYKSNNTMPANFFRKMEDLDQYRRHIDVSIDSNSSDDELFTKDYNSIPREWTRNQIYEHYARSVRATNGFYLIPFPDWSFAKHHTAKKESCYIKDRMVCRRKLMRMLELAVRPDSYHPKLVYDLDSLLLNANETKSIQMIDDDVSWTNYKGDSESDSLHFESRFESGNLRRAYRVSEYEYDLILNPDVNSTGRQQWFYFRLSGPGVCSNVPYTFNIINFEKQRSLFNQGMQPVMFSVKQSLSTGNAEWARKGSSICYYRNVFQRGDADQPYFTLSFDISFPYDHDIIYIALHYPYTYSQLMTDVVLWKRSFPQQIENVNFRVTTLCTSPCQNPVPLVIIGSNEELSKCKVNFCSARVHPSESNSSWVVRGFIDAIMTAAVVQLEDSDHNLFQDKLFMIVPMLNIDGVVHGCTIREA